MAKNTNRKSGSSVYLSNEAWGMLENKVDESRNSGDKTNVSALIDAAVRCYFGEKSPRELIMRHLQIIEKSSDDCEYNKQIKLSINVIKDCLDKI